jgi:hypothetical protein
MGLSTKEAYFINNIYPTIDKNLIRATFFGNDETKIFIDGGDMNDADMVITSGQVTIRNLGLKNAWFTSDENPTISLNLKDVTINGANFLDLELKNGQWENVKIYPSVKVQNTKIENLKVYNVTFPHGKPWVDASSETSIDLIESSKPFEWPEVHVPTPEELGLKIDLE